jgi:hypothetical protein
VLLERIRISNAAQAQDKKQTKRKQSLWRLPPPQIPGIPGIVDL